MFAWRYRTQAELDASVNARATVPDVSVFLKAYADESTRARASLECRMGVKYGLTQAERLDIFPARKPGSPIFVFIHGGYWRALDASDSSFMAPTFVDAGAAVIAVNYELAPKARIDEIVRQCRAALAWVWRHAREFNGDAARIHVSGSSAGGHLTGMLIANGWADAFGAKGLRIQSASPLSGLFDLEPVRLSEVNGWARMDAAEATRNSPMRHLPAPPMPLIVSFGHNEALEFAIQSEAYMAACAAVGCEVRFVEEPGSNHFDLPMRLMDRRNALTKAVFAAMGLQQDTGS